MTKIILSTLLAVTLGASEYNYELSPMAGYVFPNASQDLKNHTIFGAEMQFNGFDLPLKPELSVLFSRSDYENSTRDTDIFRSALNGVYEFQQSDNVTPFVKAGLGYETMSEHQYDNHNSVFVDAGAGIKVALTKQIALKLEAIEMFKHNNDSWDNNLLFMAGLNFAFGEKAQPAAPIITPAIAAPVVTPEPKTEVKYEPVAVVAAPAAAACPINVDTDKDGVFDPQDKCPNTPEGFKVDGEGCPLKATLHLNFVTDGSTVDAAGVAEIKEFAAFLKESPAYKANIIGHTDSTGSDKYNQKLSEKRAQTVQNMLIDQGVTADRLTASGEGEKMPVASNKTKQGRAENRRIEVDFCK